MSSSVSTSNKGVGCVRRDTSYRIVDSELFDGRHATISCSIEQEIVQQLVQCPHNVGRL